MLMFNLLADASIGAATGIGTRMVLRRRHWWIRMVVAASLAIVGLVLLGFLTGARSGVGPLDLRLRRVNWLDQAGIALQVPDLPGNSPTDLLDVAHMVIAIDLSWIALRAWRAGPRVAASRSQASRPVRARGIQSAPARMAAVSAPVVPIVRPIGRSRSRPMVRRQKIGRASGSNAIAIRPRSGGGQRRSLFRRRLAVQIAAYEEHRCPYCLQDIKRDDIRGSVECPICHTLHHKDCWDITGTCQVPHLNG